MNVDSDYPQWSNPCPLPSPHLENIAPFLLHAHVSKGRAWWEIRGLLHAGAALASSRPQPFSSVPKGWGRERQEERQHKKAQASCNGFIARHQLFERFTAALEGSVTAAAIFTDRVE